MTFPKLRGAIREKYGTQEAFAAAINMNPATLSSRLNGKTEWSIAEMKIIAELLQIPIERAYLYFF